MSDVDPRRFNEDASECLGRCRGPWTRRGIRVRRPGDNFADERESIGVRTRGRESEQNVTFANRVLGVGQDKGTFDGAEGEPCKVIVAYKESSWPSQLRERNKPG